MSSSGGSTFLVIVVSLCVAALTGLLVWWGVHHYMKAKAEQFEEEKKQAEEAEEAEEPQADAAPVVSADPEVVTEGFEPDSTNSAAFAEWAGQPTEA